MKAPDSPIPVEKTEKTGENRKSQEKTINCIYHYACNILNNKVRMKNKVRLEFVSCQYPFVRTQIYHPDSLSIHGMKSNYLYKISQFFMIFVWTSWESKPRMLSLFSERKLSMGLILHIMSSNILLGYTDAVLDRRYAIGIQCFSTDLLWHESPCRYMKVARNTAKSLDIGIRGLFKYW